VIENILLIFICWLLYFVLKMIYNIVVIALLSAIAKRIKENAVEKISQMGKGENCCIKKESTFVQSAVKIAEIRQP
jgi:hypothetical protein